MVFKVMLLIAFFIATTVALPVDSIDEGKRIYLHSEHTLSGASGTFRYPTSGSEYQNNERVIISAGFLEDTVFILENYTIESPHDSISIHKWVGDDLVLDKTYTGTSTDAKYFIPEGNFLIAFASDATLTRAGFNLRWAPMETFLPAMNYLV